MSPEEWFVPLGLPVELSSQRWAGCRTLSTVQVVNIGKLLSSRPKKSGRSVKALPKTTFIKSNVDTKISFKSTTPNSPKVNVGGKAQGKTEFFSTLTCGEGGFTKVFKCFEKRCLGKTGKWFVQKARSSLLYTASLRSVLAAKEELIVSHSQGTNLITWQAS